MAISNLTPALLSATGTLGTSATALYTSAAAGNGTVIKKVSLYNTDSVAHTVTMYAVPGAGTAALANTVLVISVAAGSSYIVNELNNKVMAPGETLQAKCDTAALVTFTASGFTF